MKSGWSKISHHFIFLPSLCSCTFIEDIIHIFGIFLCLNSCWTIEGIKVHTSLLSPILNDLLACLMAEIILLYFKKLTTILYFSWNWSISIY
jgi:hypothetical protein